MIKNTQKLKTLYRKLYSALPESHVDPIYPFCVQVGDKWEQSSPRCLFVGKSINGWVTDSRNVDVLFDPTHDDRIANRHDQMQWVHDLEGNEKYNTKTSAFWRVVKNVSSTYFGAQWYRNIAWSNVYKLSHEKGNPKKWLRDIQRDLCVEILNQEIELLNPDFVIFLTSGWEDFYIDRISLNLSQSENFVWGGKDFVTKAIHADNVTFVISHHPQGKNEGIHAEVLKNIVSDRMAKSN